MERNSNTSLTGEYPDNPEPSAIYQSGDTFQLWNRFKAGDRQAFAAIYRKYAGPLTQYGMQLMGDKEFTRDAVQDLFIQLWEQRNRLGEVHHSIKAYLFTCLRREMLKRVNHSPFSLDEVDALEAYTTADSADENQLFLGESTEEVHHKLLSDVKKLPERQREAIFLTYYCELDFVQVAQVMSITTRAVYKLIYKAINHLQKNIKEYSLMRFLLAALLFV